MSEYQYYEFAAIERSLSQKEMAELRAVSTRADITPARFVNHYEWGDLKANPRDWMHRYFDAFVYSANWCSCALALRVPKTVFRKPELRPYASEYSLTIDGGKEHWIFHWSLDESEDYDRFVMDDGRGWMSRLAPLREELLRGDLRPLYLGWLAEAHTMTEDEQEPEVPPGLATLSPAQQALVQFLEIDPDLLAAASLGSTDFSPINVADIDNWLESWSSSDMKTVIRHIVSGKEREAEEQVKSCYTSWLKAQRSTSQSNPPSRTVADLHKLAESAAAEQKKHEARAHKKLETERRRQCEAYLKEVMDTAKTLWKSADAQVYRGVASGYDEAVSILGDLAEGYTLTASRAAFERDLQRFLAPHSKRRAFLRRLVERGLWSD